jgi:hypothetical protein
MRRGVQRGDDLGEIAGMAQRAVGEGLDPPESVADRVGVAVQLLGGALR